MNAAPSPELCERLTDVVLDGRDERVAAYLRHKVTSSFDRAAGDRVKVWASLAVYSAFVATGLGGTYGYTIGEFWDLVAVEEFAWKYVVGHRVALVASAVFVTALPLVFTWLGTNRSRAFARGRVEVAGLGDLGSDVAPARVTLDTVAFDQFVISLAEALCATSEALAIR